MMGRRFGLKRNDSKLHYPKLYKAIFALNISICVYL